MPTNDSQSPTTRRSVIRAGALAAAGSLIVPRLSWAEGPVVPPARTPRLVVRRSEDRGRARHGGWLDARFTFSFSRYRDPRHMGFRALRVMNEDRISGGGGFPMHPHDNMEILTYVLSGSLKHRDSLGGGGIIKPGDTQRMSAGTGIRHSEFNPSARETTHLLQIWMLPSRRGLRPSYEQKRYATTRTRGQLQLLASPTRRQDSVLIQSNLELYGANLAPREAVDWTIRRGRHVWIQVARGSLQIGRTALKQGDGVRSSDPGKLRIVARENAEFLLFDLA